MHLSVHTLVLLFDLTLTKILANGRFLERKICNPLVNVADMLKKLSGSGQLYLLSVKIVIM